MPILMPESFAIMPWKNGGGVTREIAKAAEGDRILWRLSLADVESDGPFSAFPGLTRILTVLTGAGLVLRTPEGVIEAPPLHPVRFSGNLPVTCERIAGPVRDLNLIFDAGRMRGSVTLAAGPQEIAPEAGLVGLWPLAGRAAADGVLVSPGALCLGTEALALGPGARALVIHLAPAI